MSEQLQLAKKRLHEVEEDHRVVKATYEKQIAELKMELFLAELRDGSKDISNEEMKLAAERAYEICDMEALEDPVASSGEFCRMLMTVLETSEPAKNRMHYAGLFYRYLFTHPTGSEGLAVQLLLTTTRNLPKDYD